MLKNKIALGLSFTALIVIVLLILAPRTPKLDPDQLNKSPLDLKVEQAIDMVQTSGMPMQGIALLKEVLEEDPQHMEAIWQLGMFSMQSGQYEKAIERFNSLIEIVNDSSKKENIGPLFELFKAYKETGNNQKAIETLNQLENLVEDEKLKAEIKEKKTEINNELKHN